MLFWLDWIISISNSFVESIDLWRELWMNWNVQLTIIISAWNWTMIMDDCRAVEWVISHWNSIESDESGIKWKDRRIEYVLWWFVMNF